MATGVGVACLLLFTMETRLSVIPPSWICFSFSETSMESAVVLHPNGEGQKIAERELPATRRSTCALRSKPTEIRIRLRRSGPSEPSGGDGRCAQAPRKRRIKELGSRDEPTFAAAMWQCTTRSLAWLKSKDAGFARSLLQPFSNAQLWANLAIRRIVRQLTKVKRKIIT